MATPQKQPIPINFAQGVNTKTDPWQLAIGQFLSLKNSVFDKGGMLMKRNGYGSLSNLPSENYNYLTTLNGNLTAVGQNISAFNASSQSWIEKGNIQPVSLSTLPLIRNSINQIQCDSIVAANGLACTVYSEKNVSTTVYKYVIASSVSGQNVIAPTLIPVSSGAVTGSPRVFLLGTYFVIVFTNVVSATSHLQYISIPSENPSLVTTNQDIAAAYTSATTVAWDGLVFNNNLYLAYNTESGAQAVAVTFLTLSQAILGQSPAAPTLLTGEIATMMSLCVDETLDNPLIYVNYYDLASTTGFSASLDLSLTVVQVPLATIATDTVLNITSAAQNGSCYIYYEVANAYSYDSGIKTNYISLIIVTGASAAAPAIVIRSLGLASKAFIIDGIIYFLAAYASTYQSSYFLMNGNSRQAAPIITAKLAYENGGGYLAFGLPGVTLNGSIVQIPYLFKDLITPISTLNNTTQTTTGGVYAQTGINLATFNLGLQNITSVEIAKGLQIGGGFGWLYDGYLPVEKNFFVWPEDLKVSTSTSGGHLADQQYAYIAVFEWTDNQGNIERSAESIPVFQTTAGGGTSTNTINVPTYRLTYKVLNKVKLTLFRWSTAQPVYYQVTSISSATLNSTTADSVAITDTLADASILGNSIVYTNGGVVEDTNPPASNIMTIFDTRVWLVDAEDPNLLWYSKQIIEATPVEWSDLFTFFIAPNTGTVASTGPITALAPMDDKLIIFKANSMYYINGNGPDNTGFPNPSYNGPIFIASTVGCIQPASIVLIDEGLMFQSNKGIWLLPRGISEPIYIGAPVEAFNASVVQSAVSVPETNHVIFTLDSGEMLMYDYFFKQWGTFVGIPAVSSCIYQNLHTYVDQFGQVFQETPGLYLDGANPVLMGFITGWINVAGIQGFERFYYFYFVGRYLSPHFMNVQLSYDYVDTVVQNKLIRPSNFSPVDSSPFGDQPAPFGSETDFYQWKIHAKKQKCQSFQIALDEIFDPSLGTAPGAGFTLSGLNMIASVKRGSRPIPAKNTAG